MSAKQQTRGFFREFVPPKWDADVAQILIGLNNKNSESDIG